MNSFDVDPGVGAGPVGLGMTRSEAHGALEQLGLEMRSARRWATFRPEAPPALMREGPSFQVYFDHDDRVEGIELGGPPNDDRKHGARPSLIARWMGLDVFETSAVDIVRLMADVAPVDTEHIEYPATYDYPTAGVIFWRSGKPAAHREEVAPYFESVLVKRATSSTAKA
jgi:hypothetical protein